MGKRDELLNETFGDSAQTAPRAARNSLLDEVYGGGDSAQSHPRAGGLLDEVYVKQPTNDIQPPSGIVTKPVPADAPFDAQFNTKLAPGEEAGYAAWKALNAPGDSSEDYDNQGAYKAGISRDPKTGHMPDTFKKPGHPTFSDESQYKEYGNPGHWGDDGKGGQMYFSGKQMRVAPDVQAGRELERKQILAAEVPESVDMPPEHRNALLKEIALDEKARPTAALEALLAKHPTDLVAPVTVGGTKANQGDVRSFENDQPDNDQAGSGVDLAGAFGEAVSGATTPGSFNELYNFAVSGDPRTGFMHGSVMPGDIPKGPNAPAPKSQPELSATVGTPRPLRLGNPSLFDFHAPAGSGAETALDAAGAIADVFQSGEMANRWKRTLGGISRWRADVNADPEATRLGLLTGWQVGAEHAIDEASRKLFEARRLNQTPGARLAADSTMMLLEQGPALLAAAAAARVGSPGLFVDLVGLGPMGLQVFGDSYAKYGKYASSPGERARLALADTLIEVLPEKIALHKFLQLSGTHGAQLLARRAAETLGVEIGEEWISDIGHHLTDQATIDPNKTMGSLLEDMQDSAKGVAMVMPGLSLFGRAGHHLGGAVLGRQGQIAQEFERLINETQLPPVDVNNLDFTHQTGERNGQEAKPGSPGRPDSVPQQGGAGASDGQRGAEASALAQTGLDQPGQPSEPTDTAHGTAGGIRAPGDGQPPAGGLDAAGGGGQAAQSGGPGLQPAAPDRSLPNGQIEPALGPESEGVANALPDSPEPGLDEATLRGLAGIDDTEPQLGDAAPTPAPESGVPRGTAPTELEQAFGQGETNPYSDDGKWPQPNEHGVYDAEPAYTVMYPGKARARLEATQIGPNRWISTFDYGHKSGTFQGMAAPLTADNVYETKDQALAWAAAKLQKEQRLLINQLKAHPSPGSDKQILEARKIAEWMGGFLKDLATNPDKPGLAPEAATAVEKAGTAAQNAEKNSQNDEISPAPEAGDKLRTMTPEIRAELQAMAKNAGWAEIGGRLTRTPDPDDPTQEKIGRTQWIPKEDWWQGRVGGLNEEETRKAVGKALAGWPLGKNERRAIDYMIDRAAERLALTKDFETDQLPKTPRNYDNAQLAARALELDPDIVERLSIQHEDDAAYWEALREWVNERDQAQNNQGGQEDRGPQEGAGGTKTGTLGRAKRTIADDFPLESYTPEQLKQRELEAEAAAKAKAKAEVAPKGPKVTVDQVDLFNPQSSLFTTAAGFPAAPTYYSQLHRSIQANKQEKMPPAQWMGLLSNMTKNGGAKQEEIDATGILDWLKLVAGDPDLKGHALTKQQVLAFLQESIPEVSTKVVGGTGAGGRETDRIRVQLDALGYDLETDDINGVALSLHNRNNEETFDAPDIPASDRGPQTFDDLPTHVRAIIEQFDRAAMDERDLTQPDTDTRYGKYVLPGGENYREILLTIPKQGEGEGGQAKNAAEAMALAKQKVAGNFYSGHFDQPNIVAHLRTTDRTDTAGKRVLFIEEIQSDWAEEGRERGFATTGDHIKRNALEARIKQLRQNGTTEAERAEYFKPGNLVKGYGGVYKVIAYHPGTEANNHRWSVTVINVTKEGAALLGERERNHATDPADALMVEARRELATLSSRPPAGPFVGRTESWVALALKRAIRMAAEGNYDSIAWTTGEQQRQRYKLEDDAGEGAHGMHGFYDGIVPKVAGRVLDKLGGDKVGKVHVVFGRQTTQQERDKNNLKQPGFAITPALKAAALRGVPMFARNVGGDADSAFPISHSAPAPEFVRRAKVNIHGKQGGEFVHFTIDLKTPEGAEFSDAFNDVIAAGIPLEGLRNIRGFALHDSEGHDTGGLHYTLPGGGSFITLSKHHLEKAARTQDPAQRQVIRGWLAHELTHAMDQGHEEEMADSGQYASSSSTRLSFDRKELYTDGAHGDLFNEAWELMEKVSTASQPLRALLAYPLMHVFNNGMTPAAIRVELTAQMGRLFFGSPQLLREHMPLWYAAAKEIFDNGKPVKSVDDIRGRIRATLSGDARSAAGIRGALRAAADRGDGQGGGNGQVPGGLGAAAPPGRGDPLRVRAEDQSRPDEIRKYVSEVFGSHVSEGLMGRSKNKILGFYRPNYHTTHLGNRNDLDTLAHEVGHHISNTERSARAIMNTFQGELLGGTFNQGGHYIGKPKKLQIEEGFAEFIRLYLTDRPTAARNAPGFTKAFEAFLNANPKYKEPIAEFTRRVAENRNQPPEKRILDKVGRGRPTLKESLSAATDQGARDAIVYQTLDKWKPLNRVVEDLQPGILPSKNPYIAARLLAGDAGMVEDWLTRWTIPFDYTKRLNKANYGKPLMDILEPVLKNKATERKFLAYLIARRASELAHEGRENLFDAEEIRAGLTLQTPEFDRVADALYKFNDSLLDYRIEAGILTPELAAKFREYEAYVPFFRMADGFQADDPQSSHGMTIHRLKGGTQNLRDVIENVILNTSRTIRVANRNHVVQLLADLVRATPGSGHFAEEIPVPQTAIALATEKIIKQLEDQGVVIDQSMATNLAVQQLFFQQKPINDERKGVFIFMEKGKYKALQVNDPLLWDALNRMEPQEIGFLTSLFAFPARLARAGIVLAPQFFVSNFFRDTMSAAIQAKGSFVPIVSSLAGVGKGLEIRHNSKVLKQMSDSAMYYRALGGGYADMWHDDTEEMKAALTRMAHNSAIDKALILSPAGIVRLLEKVGGAVEIGARINEFEGVSKDELAKGADPVDAALLAVYSGREVSTDFAQHGANQTLRMIARTTMFLNPALQGLRKSGKVAGGLEGRRAQLKAMMVGGTMMLGSLLLYLANRDQDWFKQIEDWERNTYWHFKLGANVYRIPKPFEYGLFFSSIPEAAMELAINKNGPQFRDRVLQGIGMVLGFRIVPHVPNVLYQWAYNRDDFAGHAIVPDAQENLEPELQAGPRTSLSARVLARGTARIGQKLEGAGFEDAAALVKTSPLKTDFVVRQFFGGLGQYVVMAADQTLRLVGDYPAQPEMHWQEYPVISKFVRNPDTPNAKQITDFYRELERIRRAAASLKQYADDQAKGYEDLHAKQLDRKSEAESTAKRLSKDRKEAREVYEDPLMSGKQKREQLDQIYKDMRQEARDYIEER